MKRRKFIGISAATLSLNVACRPSKPPAGKPLLSFGMITDVQYADIEPKEERYYRESPGKLKTAVEWLSKKNLPFTLHLGDLIDRNFESFATVLPLLGGLGHPTFHLLGNHDYAVAETAKSQIVKVLGMPHDYYQFKQGGVRFLMLDTNDLSFYKYPEGSLPDQQREATLKKLYAGVPQSARSAVGGLDVTQLEWLEKELTDADQSKERVIVCCHHPLVPENGYQALNQREILALIDRHSCVAACLSGHNHAGAEVVRNGVLHLTFKSILHEPGENAFSAVHIYSGHLYIEGNGREKSRTFSINPTH